LKTTSNSYFYRFNLIDEPSHQWIISLFIISLLLLPFGFMTFKGLFGALSVICLLLSLLVLRLKQVNSKNFFKEEHSFLIILYLSTTTISLLLTQIIRGDFSAAAYDGPIRLLAALPILIAIYKYRINFPKLVSLVIPGALLGILLYAKFNPGPDPARLSNYYLDPIFWGNYSIILGFLSFASIQSEDRFFIKIYKISGFVLGISMSLMSQSRAGWIAAIGMVLVLLAINWKDLTFKKFITYVFLIASILVSLYFFIDGFKIRIESAISEILIWHSNTQNISSTGIRLNMWKMSIHLFSLSPWVGYGELSTLPVTNDPYILSFADSDSIITIQCCGPHNELAAQALRSGIFGIFSFVATYFIPIFIFIKSKRTQTTLMGMMLCVGIFICSFATEMLGLKLSYTFYAIFVSGFIATALWQRNAHE
jgi:O-antigen ligase